MKQHKNHGSQIRGSGGTLTMASNRHKFELTTKEAANLLKAIESNDGLASMIQSAKHVFAEKVLVEIDIETCERLREFLTERLAETGFASDYSLTKQGEVLEELIDRFYINGGFNP